MIETTDEAVTYLEMVARRESGDLAEAALIVTRELRQARQTIADLKAAERDGCHCTVETRWPYLSHAIECCDAWEPGARLIGNVPAKELGDMLRALRALGEER